MRSSRFAAARCVLYSTLVVSSFSLLSFVDRLSLQAIGSIVFCCWQLATCCSLFTICSPTRCSLFALWFLILKAWLLFFVIGRSPILLATILLVISILSSNTDLSLLDRYSTMSLVARCTQLSDCISLLVTCCKFLATQFSFLGCWRLLPVDGVERVTRGHRVLP